jgi:DNA-binding MarR family transcriptional regulator
MKSTPGDPNEDLGNDLLLLIARLNRWSNQHADMRLPLAQARLLSWIEERSAARISDLAQAENCTQPGMTQQVKRLEANGLVQRAPDPSDARAVLISLTDKGRGLLHDIRRARAQAVAPVIAQIDEAARCDLQNALASLSRLLNVAAAGNPATQSAEN